MFTTRSLLLSFQSVMIKFLRFLKYAFVFRSIAGVRFLAHLYYTPTSRLGDHIILSRLGYLTHHLDKICALGVTRTVRGRDKYELVTSYLKDVIQQRQYLTERHASFFQWIYETVRAYENFTGIAHASIGASADEKIKNKLALKHERVDHSQLEALVASRKSRRYSAQCCLLQPGINRIIQMVMQIPTSCNRQSLRVVPVYNNNMLDTQKRPFNVDLIEHSPLLLYIADSHSFYKEKHTGALHSGAACYAALLLLEEAGYTATWMYYGESYDQSSKLKTNLGLTSDYYIYSVIAVGLPTEDLFADRPKPEKLEGR
ncbi:hypothetical protein N9W76_00725 [Planktomarina temperata]|nr:hypothetical protein [Planktomarina temperata]